MGRLVRGILRPAGVTSERGRKSEEEQKRRGAKAAVVGTGCFVGSPDGMMRLLIVCMGVKNYVYR